MTFAAIMLAGCTSKEEMLQQRVQSMAASAELGTVEYTVKKIVKCDDKQTFAIGDRKILFRSTAYLKAGVDLAGFTANNVQIDGKTCRTPSCFPSICPPKRQKRSLRIMVSSVAVSALRNKIKSLS